MDKEKTHIDYIKNPELIEDLSLETIDEWIAQGPYVQSYHLIKAIKLKSIYGIADKSHFNKVASVITDRVRLFHILEEQPEKKEKKKKKGKSIKVDKEISNEKDAVMGSQEEPESNESQEDENSVLDAIVPAVTVALAAQNELDISDKNGFSKGIEEKAVELVEEEETLEEFELDNNIPLANLEIEVIEENKTEVVIEEEESLEDWDTMTLYDQEILTSEKSVDEVVTSDAIEDDEEAAVSTAELSEELSEFSEWLLAFSRAETEVNETRLDKGISLENAAVSETLAYLMYNQGHIDQAIGMYRKLSLTNPEKSAYFAALIEKMKK